MGKAKQLCQEWGLDVKQALYSEWGNWYNKLKKFPAALLDANGYYIVNSDEELNITGIKVTKEINIKNGIASLPGYVMMKVDDILIPEEIVNPKNYNEGSVINIFVNKYERDKNARSACLQHYGYRCHVCEISLSEIYGNIALNFIHVHHLVSISTIAREYTVNPIQDLRPVCPNCHAIIHHRNPPFTIDEIRNLIKNQVNWAVPRARGA